MNIKDSEREKMGGKTIGKRDGRGGRGRGVGIIGRRVQAEAIKEKQREGKSREDE